jgi:hypothetical protein
LSETASFNDLIVFFDGTDFPVPEDFGSSVRFVNCPAALLALSAPFAKLRGKPSKWSGPFATSVSVMARDKDMDRAAAKPLPFGAPFEFGMVFVIDNSVIISVAVVKLEMDPVTIGLPPPRYRHAHGWPKSNRRILSSNAT